MKKVLIIMLLMSSFTLMGMSGPASSDTNKWMRKISKNYKWLSKGGVKKIGFKKWFYSRTARIVASPEKGVTCKMSISVVYKKSGGGNWQFQNYSYGSSNCKGYKKPSSKKLIEAIKANLEGFIGGSYNEIVGDITGLKLSKNPKYAQGGPNSLEANFEVTYSQKTSATEITKYHRVIRCLFKKSGGVYSLYMTNEYEGSGSKKQILSVKKFKSPDELNKIRTLADINAEREAAIIINRLPKIEIPKFKSGDRFIYYLHDKMLNGTTLEMQAILYKRFPKSYFVKNRKNVLHRRDFNSMQKILKNKETYKKLYCKYPKIMHKQENMIQFYNREKRSASRFAIFYDENEKFWRINAIEFYVPTSSDEISRIEMLGDVNCDKEPTLSVELEKFKIGDSISFKTRNGLEYGVVTKIDRYNQNRYLLKLKSKTMWGGAELMKKVDSSKIPKEKKIGFKVGDRVEVRFSNGSYKGTVKEVNVKDKKLFIDFDKIKDSWAYPEYTQKIKGEKIEKAEKAEKREFQVGDKVKVKFRTGSYEGVVKKITKIKLYVEFKTIQATWVSKVFVTLIK